MHMRSAWTFIIPLSAGENGEEKDTVEMPPYKRSIIVQSLVTCRQGNSSVSQLPYSSLSISLPLSLSPCLILLDLSQTPISCDKFVVWQGDRTAAVRECSRQAGRIANLLGHGQIRRLQVAHYVMPNAKRRRVDSLCGYIQMAKKRCHRRLQRTPSSSCDARLATLLLLLSLGLHVPHCRAFKMQIIIIMMAYHRHHYQHYHHRCHHHNAVAGEVVSQPPLCS